jgi:hypothetical protein
MSQAVITSNQSLSVNKALANYFNTISPGNAVTVDFIATTSTEYIEVDYLTFTLSPAIGSFPIFIHSVDLNQTIYSIGPTGFAYSRQENELLPFINNTGAQVHPKKIRIPPSCTLRLSVPIAGIPYSITLKLLGTRFINSP